MRKGLGGATSLREDRLGVTRAGDKVPQGIEDQTYDDTRTCSEDRMDSKRIHSPRHIRTAPHPIQ